ncbi:MAG: indole-3-glycerol phosphate synthase TrpC [Eubacteriales bacterium]
MNILDEIAAYTRKRVEVEKTVVSPEEMRKRAEKLSPDTGFPFEKALRKPGLSYICEVKRASPSKGLIAESFPYLTIAGEYEAAGASALSVLTEPRWFGGSLSYLHEIASAVKIPILRKDFTVDPYMIDQAKASGASAVLLICSLLKDTDLADYLSHAHALGLSALVEAHDEREVDRALNLGARIIGVNNRDLKTFTVDVNNSTKYRKLVPTDRIFVSESGIRTRADVEVLEQNGTNAVLIGETLMRCKDKKAELDRLRGR